MNESGKIYATSENISIQLLISNKKGSTYGPAYVLPVKKFIQG
jgi:hypothetical protein